MPKAPVSAPHAPRVLIVDDERDIRDLVAEILRLEGLEPLQAADGSEAIALIRQGVPAVVLMDVMMPGMNGMQVLKESRKVDAVTPIILMTANGSIGSAVEAVKSGAYDYVTKPFQTDDLVLTIRRALESRRLQQENQTLRSQVDRNLSLRERMGSSDAIRRVLADVDRVSPTDFTVIVLGETGSGKELVARGIHQLSQRAAGPFVPVDCGAIQTTLIESELFGHEKGAFTGADRQRPGKFEQACGGTLFLDEVQNLPLAVQTKFLRALQERQVCHVGGAATIEIDIRVIAATNQDLAALVADGRFRQDLFHRLDEFRIALPPLRERHDDIIYLAKRFLDLAREELRKGVVGFAPATLEVLLTYAWPGNVRELRNVIRRSVLLADRRIEPEQLGLTLTGADAAAEAEAGEPTTLDGSMPFKELVRRSVAKVERAILQEALRQTGGNKAKAARLLQIDYKTMHTKARDYGLIVPRDDGAG